MKHALLVLLILGGTYAAAQDCAVANYYRVVTIDNTAGDALTDYQVRVQLNTLDLVNTGKLRADGGDIRVFSNDCTPLSFWGDSLGTSANTHLWVKIPAIPAGGMMTFQIYYGNSDATTVADGDDTFIFFDDFSSGAVDPGKWETIGAYTTFEVVDGILNYASTSENPGPRFKFARATMPFSNQVIIDCSGTRSSSSGFGFSSADTTLDRIIFRDAGFGFDTLNQVAYMPDTVSNGYQVNGFYPLLPFPRSEFNTSSITAEINDANHLSISRFENVALSAVNADIYEWVETEMSAFHFIISTFGSSPIMLDNIRVRQSTSTPPATSIGDELDPTTTGISTLISPADVQVFPNPASNYCIVRVDAEAFVLEIVDATNRTTYYRSVTLSSGQSHRIDLDEIAAGMYYLNVMRNSDRALMHSRPIVIAR